MSLAAELNDLDNRIRATNSELREARQHLKTFVPAGLSMDAFMALPEDVAVEERIARKEQELHAARRAAEIQERQRLAPLLAPAFPAAFSQVLARTLDDVAVGAANRVRQHLARHQMQAHGETWLTEGLDYVTDDACPFCEQPLGGIELLQAYRTHFGAEYHALRDEVVALGRQVNDSLGERVASAVEQRALQNANDSEFWKQYCDFEPPVLAMDGSVGEAIGGLRQTAGALLAAKSAAPLDRIAPDDAFTRSLEAFEALRTSIAAYNAAVAAANAAINETKQNTRTANVRDVESALARLRAQQARHTPEVIEICESESRLHHAKRELEHRKAELREELDRHTQQVVTQYGQSINRYLERINAGFRITAPTHTYRGGTPSSSYQIVINQTAVEVGDADTPLDQPSFRNTLSAGDRSTLALAFFLAQLEQDAEAPQKLVVFDDPFTSQDGFRRNHTIFQIQKCAERCAQVIVLSHEPLFLKDLWDRLPPADRKTLQLARIGEENTTIVECDIDRATQARHRADVEALQRYFADGSGDRREAIQKLRPVLEGFCRHFYPAQFTEQDTLGNIVGKIRAGAGGHPLGSIADDLDEINLYCRRYHHAENPAAATEPIDDGELRGYVGRALRLVGHLT